MKCSWKILLRNTLCVLAVIPAVSQAKEVEASDGGKSWTHWEVKSVRASKKVDSVNPFGGAAKHRVAKPGFFRVLKKSNRWWLVDPDGCLFLSKGINSVERGRVGGSDADTWAGETYDLLVGAGFNTLGRWSDSQAFVQIEKPLPWCATLSFMKSYDKRRSFKNGDSGFPNETLPVFDEEWPAFCEQYAREETASHKEDRWLLGYFSDNELPFRPDALKKYLTLPADDSGCIAANRWMIENKIKRSRMDDPDTQAEFLEVMARRYFETVAAALKKADPNHLYIGSRLHGRCINESVLRASAACDVVTINYYHRWVPEKDRTSDWLKWSGRPFIASEFYAMKDENKKARKEDGAGFRVLSYEDAGLFYHTYVGAMLKDIPGCVGWHWFKYANDNEEWQKGLVSTDGTVHEPLVDAMTTVNKQAYLLRGLR